MVLDLHFTSCRSAVAASVACLLLVMPAMAMARPTSCDAAKAKEFKGKPFSPELAEEARRAAGASSVRGVGPGMISSADRRPNRLDIEVDKQQVVTGFRCE